MRMITAILMSGVTTLAFATLPPPTDDAKARAEDAKAKTTWSDKVAAYKTCLAMDRTVDAYRRSLQADGKTAPTPVATPPCTDPGPYGSPVAAGHARPLEASGAHSPPETAAAPPSSTTPQSEEPQGKPPAVSQRGNVPSS